MHSAHDEKPRSMRCLYFSVPKYLLHRNLNKVKTTHLYTQHTAHGYSASLKIRSAKVTRSHPRHICGRASVDIDYNLHSKSLYYYTFHGKKKDQKREKKSHVFLSRLRKMTTQMWMRIRYDTTLITIVFFAI